ncbi:hypothetical protein J4420_06015 [Candidatus Woesearchaeota archaeon]|nr:hypothetical protein [Candidatus Woesearchaeota archaeon]
MISNNDQLELFGLLSKNINQNIDCYAFGGNAMMFYGYKDETKDVDLLFEQDSQRAEFIRALRMIGYSEMSLLRIYIPEKAKEKHAPVIYKRGESRFDLFVGKIFRTQISPRMKEDLFAVHDFKHLYLLQVKVLRKEHLVLLKAITDRQNDFDDIKTIVQKEPQFDWQYLIDEAIWQHEHGDSWILVDLEKMLTELKRYVFMEEKYLKQLYAAQRKKKL